ncbi:Rhodanese-like domain-containing protein [Cladochytrium replicatum]|nr:Rhodanese-like domain-containing protein [Cladochytrium replicatum]
MLKCALLRRVVAVTASRSFSTRILCPVAPFSLNRPSQIALRLRVPGLVHIQSRKYSEAPEDAPAVISKEDLHNLVTGKVNEPYILIDVREADEVAAGQIDTAKWIRLGELPDALMASKTEFQQLYGFPQVQKDDNVIFYCRSGRRSANAVAMASMLGFKRVRHYDGGWLGWTSE